MKNLKILVNCNSKKSNLRNFIFNIKYLKTYSFQQMCFFFIIHSSWNHRKRSHLILSSCRIVYSIMCSCFISIWYKPKTFTYTYINILHVRLYKIYVKCLLFIITSELCRLKKNQIIQNSFWTFFGVSWFN